MDNRLETRRLRYFMQVLESGSVRGAAEVLDMDPSAVSRAVGILETECGTRLLERRGRGVVPTDAGELLAGYLRRQQSQKQQLLAQMESIEQVERGHVGIVAGEGFVDWLMRAGLRGFMASRPNITIDLEVAGSDDIEQAVVEERAHIGVLFQPPKDERLRSHHSHAQPVVATVLPSHPLAGTGRALDLADLMPYPGAMLHRGFGVRQHIEAAQLSEGVRLPALLTTNSFHALAQFAEAGLGYALSSRFSLPGARGDAGVRLVELAMRNPLLHQGRAHVVSRHGRMLPPAAAELLACLVRDMKNAAAPASAP